MSTATLARPSWRRPAGYPQPDPVEQPRDPRFAYCPVPGCTTAVGRRSPSGRGRGTAPVRFNRHASGDGHRCTAHGRSNAQRWAETSWALAWIPPRGGGE